ncbi:hypothetical protein L596_002767 [Steinernema carpocapsae]|uniref:Low-density lipoprotein receptor domain class A n=1 Tax=Steinernema carpocapsae TaxID=34508 RepID=A0A4V6I7J7_STECR|nr:hypothetical protein L596_002767 [Steinernema carpocapsae]
MTIETAAEPVVDTTETVTEGFVNATKETTVKTIRCRSRLETPCENGGECIEKRRMCDGFYDCFDRSDEDIDICGHKDVRMVKENRGLYRHHGLKCPETWFYCKDASRCLEPVQVIVLRDGSDEASFCHQYHERLQKEN